jgi:hypothetical protein
MRHCAEAQLLRSARGILVMHLGRILRTAGSHVIAKTVPLKTELLWGACWGIHTLQDGSGANCSVGMASVLENSEGSVGGLCESTL